MSSERQVSVSRTIAASPQVIFDLLANPAMHPVIDGSGTVKGASGKNPERLSLGAKFSMDMRMGLPYVISNTVVEFEEPRLIAWRHIGGHRWRYELTPTPDGAATEVTETFDWSTARFPPAIEWMGYPKKHPAGMAATLERLDAAVTAPADPA